MRDTQHHPLMFQGVRDIWPTYVQTMVHGNLRLLAARTPQRTTVWGNKRSMGRLQKSNAQMHLWCNLFSNAVEAMGAICCACVQQFSHWCYITLCSETLYSA